MSVLRVRVALVMGAMLLAVAAAKARQDGPKNDRPSEIRTTSDGVAAAKARQDGPKNVALLEPAFGLTATPELITTRIGQIKLKRVPAGEFMMSLNSSASGYDEEFLDNAASEAGKKKHRVRITRPFYLGVYEVTQCNMRPSWATIRAFSQPMAEGRIGFRASRPTGTPWSKSGGWTR